MELSGFNLAAGGDSSFPVHPGEPEVGSAEINADSVFHKIKVSGFWFRVSGSILKIFFLS
jgi:hypothetical protein